jgi:membrane protease YdiL (CAAX protease family)
MLSLARYVILSIDGYATQRLGAESDDGMKRNTAVALIYWCTLHVALFAAGRAQAFDRRLFFTLGAAYVLLLWCPLPIVKFIEHRPIGSLGFREGSLPQIIPWGLGASVLVVVFLTVETWFRISFHGETLEPATLLVPNLMSEILEQFLWIGFPEEIAHRGYFLTRLRESWGTPSALFISAFLFGVGHLALGDLPRAIQAGASGLVYGIIFVETGSVFAPAIVHILINLFGGAIVHVVLS